jgi:transposase
MTYITGHDRSQLLLLPEAVDDYVGADNPVRFIDTFVDGLDLAAAGERCRGCGVKGRAVVSIKWAARQSGCPALDPGTSQHAV